MSIVRKGACGLVAAACFGLASCSGSDSGGGGGGGIIPPPSLPAAVGWQFDSPTGDLQVLVDFGNDGVGGPTTISLPIVNFGGDWDTVSDDAVLRNGDSGSVAIRIDAPGILAAMIDLSITTDLSLPNNADFPQSGVFQVSYGSDVVTCTCNPTTVDLDLNGGAQTATLDWDTFDEIDPGGIEPEYQRAAAFAFGASFFLLDQFGFGLEALDVVWTDETELRNAGSGNPLIDTGDLYPPVGSPGTVAVTWIDNGLTGAGELGAGDDFTVVFTDFWVMDPSSTIDEQLLNGTIQLIDYDEVASPLSLGFDRIAYQNFVIVETNEVSPGVYQSDSEVELNGSVRLKLTAQN